MAFSWATLVLIFVMANVFGLSLCKVYKVGDSAGWAFGSVDYQRWAQSKKFYVGDTLLFQYDPSKENVVEVNGQDFKGCNGASPIRPYVSGEDSITMDNPDPHFFISSVFGHCEAGVKLYINVFQSRNDSIYQSPGPIIPEPPQSTNSNDAAGSSLYASGRLAGTLLVGGVTLFYVLNGSV